jgi:citrate lyase synthetase
MADNCYGCTKRYLGCHSKCEVYAKYKETLQKPSPESERDYHSYTNDKLAKYKSKRKW